jgi:hypothetical protein
MSATSKVSTNAISTCKGFWRSAVKNLLQSFVVMCLWSGISHAEYVDDCQHYGALAVAVQYVRLNQLLTADELYSSEVQFFKESGLNDDRISRLMALVKGVFEDDNIFAEPELFEIHMEECVREAR